MTNIRRWGPGLLLVSPSILLVAVFVYGLIGWNVKVSLSDWRTAVPSSKWAGLASYRDLNADPAWTEALHHILLFTVTFILGTLLLGMTLAFLLEKGVRGEGFFRSVYLFPMAVSFIAAGVVWRWSWGSHRLVGRNRDLARDRADEYPCSDGLACGRMPSFACSHPLPARPGRRRSSRSEKRPRVR